MELRIDKQNWTPLKLGDVFTKREENDKENAGNRFDRFLKVEHFDKGSLHIRRWSSQKNGDELNPTFYKIFRKGQILFPTRNPHLRRTVLAGFDGICGEKTLTLEANEELILPEFAPFLFHSELFYAHTAGAIIGSTNPHCRWRDVANYEFLLPPKDQQAELAELLWSINTVVEKARCLGQRIEELLLSAMKEKLSKSTHKEKLIDLCLNKPKYGANSPSKPYDNHTRYIRITDIEEFGALSTKPVSAQDSESKYILKYGDFLLARTADPGRAYYYRNQDGRCIYAGYLIKFELDMKKILPEFLFFFTQTKEFKSWINQTTRKGTLSNINSQEFSNMRVPLFSIDQQRKIINDISYYRNLLTEAIDNLTSCLDLHSSVINQIF